MDRRGEAEREGGGDVEGDVGSSHSRAATAQGMAETLRATPGSGTSIPAGTLLEGTYRVAELLGKGAMGAVYLVEHVALGKKFAAKVVASGHMDAAGLARLRNEARMASAIDHENIVRVTHLGTTEDGNVFVVMELLRGEDLRARALRHRQRAAADGGDPWLSDLEVRGIVSPLLSALDAAHAAGIVHRDLKPENVFLHERQGRRVPKIVDFGIGKLRSADESLRLTATGQIVGTPLYMAPEQTRSTHLVDHRADIYAMGVMLFELLTGRLPFEATGIYEIVLKHVTEAPPDPRSIRPDLRDEVAAVVLRCLAKSPDARFQSAAELLEAWESAWGDDAGVPSLPLTSEPVGAGGDRHDSHRRGSDRQRDAGSSGTRRSSERTGTGRESADASASASSLADTELAITKPRASAPIAGEPARPARPRAAIAGAAALLVAAGIGLWAALAARSAPEPAEGEALVQAGGGQAPVAGAPAHDAPSVEPPVAAPVPEPTPVPEPAVDPVAPVRRHVESDPPGAEVLRDGVVIGTTPLDVELSGESPVRLELRRRGYQSVEREIGPSDPETVSVELPRRARRGGDFPGLAPL